MYKKNNGYNYDRIDIPMNKQGETSHLVTVVEDDIWIGASVLINLGRRVSQGPIVAAGCVLTKDYSSYSIIGGNPSMLIKSRLSLNNKQ